MDLQWRFCNMQLQASSYSTIVAFCTATIENVIIAQRDLQWCFQDFQWCFTNATIHPIFCSVSLQSNDRKIIFFIPHFPSFPFSPQSNINFKFNESSNIKKIYSIFFTIVDMTYYDQYVFIMVSVLILCKVIFLQE